MTFSVVQKAITADTTIGASTVVLTFGSAVGAGNNVAGGFTWYNSSAGGSGATVVDDKGNTYTVIDVITDAAGVTQYALAFYFVGVPAGGPTTLTFTPPGGHNGYARAEAIEISGAGAINGHTSQLQQNISSTTVTSGNITPTQTGDFLYGYTLATTMPSPETITVGAGYTIENNGGGAGISVALADEVLFPYNSVVAKAATFTVSATGSTFDFVTGIIAFKAAPAVVEGYEMRIFRVKPPRWG